MRHLSYLLLLSLLAGCMGGKTKPTPAVYDFGLESASETVSAEGVSVQIDEITATEFLNSNRMRYRLNYQNPAQVFTYTESRWGADPVELLSAKARASATTSANPSNCALQLQLEAFDQVFDSPTDSFGIVQLNAVLKDKKTRKIIAHKQIQERVVAASADAKGGVSALKQASTAVLAKTLSWGNTMAAESSACH